MYFFLVLNNVAMAEVERELSFVTQEMQLLGGQTIMIVIICYNSLRL